MIKTGMNEAHVGSPHRNQSRSAQKEYAQYTRGSMSGGRTPYPSTDSTPSVGELKKIDSQIDALMSQLKNAKNELHSGKGAGEVMGMLKYFSSDADKLYDALGEISRRGGHR